MARILYFLPDVPQVFGGVNITYRHVATLRRLGFDAHIVHQRAGYRYVAALPGVPITFMDRIGTIPDADWMVIPETHRSALALAAGSTCRKALFCQNHFYLSMTLTAIAGRTWSDYGIERFLCLSEPIRDAMQDWLGLDGTVIRPAIDDRLFVQAPRSQRPSIAFMPRKGGSHVGLTRMLIERYADVAGLPALSGIEWRVLDGMPQKDVAKALSSAWIYLSTGHLEGLGLPPLEAMSAGAIVVGFTANGGHDYATAENGVWVDDEDTFALARATRKTLLAMLDKAPEIERLRTAGLETSKRYSIEAEAEALRAFWSANAPDARLP